MEFSRPEHGNGQPLPSPGNLPNPGIKPRSPTLQAGSLPAEQGKPPLENKKVSEPALCPVGEYGLRWLEHGAVTQKMDFQSSARIAGLLVAT